MTLILAALNRNGACICADKRQKTRHINGSIVIRDDLYKIHEFNNAPLIIFNHGVNKFNGISWKTLCSNYENLNSWNGKNLEEASEDFRSFIETRIGQQLESNLHNFPNDSILRESFFNISGKDSEDGVFKMFELHWSIDSRGLHFKSDPHRGFVRSGDGKKYLKDYVDSRSELNSLPHWESMSNIQAKDKLVELFSVAIDERSRLEGDEFSDSFDLECVSG